MMLEVSHRYTGLILHEVRAVAAYGSGDVLVILDIPWSTPADIFYDPRASVAVRQVGARYADPAYSCWRDVWGDVRTVANWLESVEEGATTKLKGRKFTKLSPSVLPPFIEVPTPSDYAVL